MEKGVTILSSDRHHTYKGFTKDNEMEFHSVNALKGERVKGNCHIQHVNSTHNRIKKWIDNTIGGESTKYLQRYLNWHRPKENMKSRSDRTNTISI